MHDGPDRDVGCHLPRRMTTHAVTHDVHAEEVVVVHRILVLGALRSDIGAADGAQQEALDRDRASVRYHEASGRTRIVRSTPSVSPTFLTPSLACSASCSSAPSTACGAPGEPRRAARAPRAPWIRSSWSTMAGTPAPR